MIMAKAGAKIQLKLNHAKTITQGQHLVKGDLDLHKIPFLRRLMGISARNLIFALENLRKKTGPRGGIDSISGHRPDRLSKDAGKLAVQ